MSIRANVANQLLKQIFIYLLANDIFVRPFGHCLGKSPFYFPHKIVQVIRQRIFILVHYSTTNFSRTTFNNLF